MAGEAIGDGLIVLIDSVLSELRRTGGLQEGRFADLALDIHSLDIRLQLRLSDLAILRIALALLRSLGSVTHYVNRRRKKEGRLDSNAKTLFN